MQTLRTEKNRLNPAITDKCIIAGPCSAESHEQVMAIAKELSTQNIQYFRAGVWKPRTRPGSFEGIGTQALTWLRDVKQHHGLATCTEVANAKHAELALIAGVDMLWIGARTTVNPFAVQELADALKGTNVAVYIKNPVNPDLNLWIGAIERFQKANVGQIGAIHRGFSSYGNSRFRNDPQWQIPIDFKEVFPDIPMICDPSHIGGKRDLIQSICQKALDLDFDGLMVETHTDPDKAWSDAAQQITPQQLHTLLGSLQKRNKHVSENKKEALEDLRFQMNVVDQDLLAILEQRMQLSKKIGEFKRENGMMILQTKRWNEVKERAQNLAEHKHLNPNFIQNLYKNIHQESINIQESVIGLQE